MERDAPGAMVVDAIRERRPHIFAHMEFFEELRDRNRALEEAFSIDQQVPPERRAFKNYRKEAVDALNRLEAKN